jgi:hypothetical protein
MSMTGFWRRTRVMDRRWWVEVGIGEDGLICTTQLSAQR